MERAAERRWQLGVSHFHTYSLPLPLHCCHNELQAKEAGDVNGSGRWDGWGEVIVARGAPFSQTPIATIFGLWPGTWHGGSGSSRGCENGKAMAAATTLYSA